MSVERPSSRRYVASIPTVPGTQVLFQRAADITQKVQEGSAEVGVVGLDRFLEYRQEQGDAMLLIADLGYSQCELVLAVPDSWVDVSSMEDLADLALEFRQQGRVLRVATKYPQLVQQFLSSRGIHYFTLAQASGTLEAAPAAGYADVIADITSTGSTLRENRLKPVEGGTVLVSQACLIGNRRALGASAVKLETARAILERIEAYMRSGSYYRLSANIQGDSPEAVARHILSQPNLAGLQGPTISKVYGPEGDGWYAVTMVVPRERLLDAVDHLRGIGGSGITVFQAGYLFDQECLAYRDLLKALGRD